MTFRPLSLSPSALTVFALAGCVAGFVAGCGDSSSTGGTTSTGSSGGTCAPDKGCPTAQTDCIGLVDNAAKGKFALRISHLAVAKPAALANTLVKGLLDTGVSLNLAGCNAQTGDPIFPNANSGTAGAFSWLLEFDTATGMLRTGGAKPEADPNAGYCFVNETVQGFPIAPLQVSAPIAGGKFEIAMPKDVVVPIYSDLMASKVILLPLRGVKIHDATISADNNCIGKFNATNLQPSNFCLPSMDTQQFIDGASLDGFVTLEDADKVLIDQLGGESLCVLLTSAGDATGKKCKRDMANKIAFQGDYCSNAPADTTCADSIALAATFSASSVAVKSTCP